ncbi:MAG TPA: aromatic amino acid lyase [Micromonosporaceae bacterium]|jgi:histidine ammonia-lyase
MDMAPVSLDGDHLDCARIDAIARAGRPVTIMDLTRARAGRDAVLAITAEHPVYGRTTGVGANRGVTADGSGHGLRLLRSHAAGAGPALPPETARAMLVVRVNQLLRGGAGVSAEVIQALVAIINRGLTPTIRRYGAIGTGDLTALAGTALCLLGERPWRGGTAPPLSFDDADALAFISSNAATIGEAALACHDLRGLVDATHTVAALSAVAYGASSEPYAQPVAAAHPHAGQAASARRMRALLPESFGPGRRIQDPYGFRALPQVHGAAMDAMEQLDRVVVLDANSSSENPLVDAAGGRVWHNGNFHTAALALALDGAGAALASTGALSIARLSSLLGDSSGTEPGATSARFLASGPSGSSGLLILEYVAHSALADVRHQATPLSAGPVALSLGTEDHASFATLAAGRLAAAVDAYRTVLACELVAAARAVRMAALPVPEPLMPSWQRVSAALEDDVSDRSVEADLDTAVALLPRLAVG